MAYLGYQPATGANDSFKVLDDIKSYTLTFDGSSSSVVSAADDTITSNEHRFIHGQKVTYNKGGGTKIAGLDDGSYYIIIVDTNTIKLSASSGPGDAVNITGVGAGTAHTLNVAFDGTNTKFKPTYDSGTTGQITRAAQLVISLNGVIQQPVDSASPSSGFGLDSGNIVFSEAPTTADTFWGHILTKNLASFEVSDNKVDNFTGNGSATEFTLSKSPANSDNVIVTIDGVVQYPSTSGNTRAYQVNDNSLVFSSAPTNGAAIQARHIGFAGAVSGTSGVSGFYGRTGNVALVNTDNIVANNATFSGNVSIAKTLTYEDVTNVDSVGLITARAGIDCNGTLEVSSTANFDGTVKIGEKIEHLGDTDTYLGFPGENLFKVATGNATRIYIDSSGLIWNRKDTSGVSTTTMLLNHATNASGNGVSLAFAPTQNYPSRFSSIDVVQDGNNNMDMLFKTTDASQNEHAKERLRIHANGAISAGVDNDSYELTLQGKTGGAPTLWLRDGTTTGNPRIIFGDTGAATRSAIYHKNNDDSLNFYTNGEVTAGNERLTITSTGRIGIGTDAPAEVLHVHQSGTTAAEFRLENSEGYLLLRSDNNLATYDAQSHIFRSRDGSDEYGKFSSDGEFGIGTNSPDKLLHIATNGDGPFIRLQNTDVTVAGGQTFGGIEFESTDSSSACSGIISKIQSLATGTFDGTSANGGALTFHTSQTNPVSLQERLRIDSSGRVVISNNAGNHTGGSQFVVMGGAINNYASAAFGNYTAAPTSGTTFAMFRFNSGSTGTSRGAEIIAAADANWAAGSSYPTRLVFSTTAASATSSTERLRITSGGFLGIGAGANTNKPLHIYTGSSDAEIRLQTNSGTEQNSYISLRQATGDLDLFTVVAGTKMKFFTANSERIRITGTGQFHMGGGGSWTYASQKFVVVEPSNAMGMLLQGNHANEGVNLTLQNIVNANNAYSSLSFADDGGQIFGVVRGKVIDKNANTGELQFHTSGTERLRINSTGQLELRKNQDGVTGRPTNRIVFKDTDSSVAANQPIGEISWYSTDAGMVNVNSWIRGINEATNGSGALLFGVKAAGSSEIEAMRITSNGAVGIGTDNPDTACDNRPGLHIHSNHNDSCRLNITTPNKDNTRIGYFGLNRFGIDACHGFQIRDSKDSYATRLLIDSSGRVMIATEDVGRSGANELTIGSASGDNGITIRSGTDSEGNIYFSDGSSGGVEETRGIIRFDHNDDAFAFFTGTGSAWSAERFRIKSDGYVEFAGASDLRLTLGSTGTAGTNTANWLRASGADLMYNAASGSHVWEIGGSEKLSIKSDGTVELKNNNGKMIDCRTSSATGDCWIALSKSNGTNKGYFGYGSSSNEQLYIVQQENADITIYNGSASRWYFKTDGQLNSATDGGINVYGGAVDHSNDAVIYADKTSSADWGILSNAYTNNYGMGIYVGNTASYGLALKDYTNNTWRFRVTGAGTIYATNTTVQGISDVRLKENIVDANSQWDDIKALRFVNYKWKADSGYADGKTYLGLIAQEVEPISPNLIEIDAQDKEDIENGVPDPEYKTVKYSIVWMKAMKALQEAQARIETLEAKVASLESS